MGRFGAESMKEAGNDMGISLRQQLSWHLTGNHYPPVPTSMIDACIQAIEAIRWQDDARIIQLPEGVLWKGNDWAPAYAIMEAHHLETWCYDEEYETPNEECE